MPETEFEKGAKELGLEFENKQAKDDLSAFFEAAEESFVEERPPLLSRKRNLSGFTNGQRKSQT